MRIKGIISVFLAILIFYNCSSDDDKEGNEKTVFYIDLSDLTIYRGTDNGQGEQVLYNNVKKVDLATKYFGTVFQPLLYKNHVIDFNGDRLTYTFSRVAGSEDVRKIVSNYTFRDDSLFIIKYDSTKVDDKSELFVALGSSPDLLYLRRSMVRYPISEERDTIHVVDEVMDKDKVLRLANIAPGNFNNVNNTIAWCNMIYLYR